MCILSRVTFVWQYYRTLIYELFLEILRSYVENYFFLLSRQFKVPTIIRIKKIQNISNSL